MSLQPKSFAEAKAKRDARPPRQRTEMKRGKPMQSRSRMKPCGKPRPGSVRDLENTLDDLVRQILRGDERVCFTDGRRGTADDPLEVSHMFGRAMRPTRWDVHLEGACHMMHRSCNARHNEDKSIYTNAFIARFGQPAYDELDRRAHQDDKRDYVTLLGMISQREAMLA